MTVASKPVRGLRRASSALRPVPDVVLIGAMKSGTTSLYAHLVDHPQIRGPFRKEVHFLDRYFDNGPGWYRSQFPVAMPMRRWLAAESTPYYFTFPPAPGRLGSVAPRASLVVLLRDPVSRAISQWSQRNAEGRDSRSFDEMVAEETALSDEDLTHIAATDPERYRRLILVHGHYADALSRWLSAFPPEQLLIKRAEDFFSNPQRIVDEIVSFLGLTTVPVHEGVAENTGRTTRIGDATRRALNSYYQPRNEALAELVGPDMAWSL